MDSAQQNRGFGQLCLAIFALDPVLNDVPRPNGSLEVSCWSRLLRRLHHCLVYRGKSPQR